MSDAAAHPEFDLRSHPLTGVSLVEASAGTGKTYSIVSLLLRALVERNLAMGEVLVLTFTRKATEELRQRVAERIREALHAWRLIAQGQADAVKDPFLSAWLAGLPAATTEHQLQVALHSLDEAPIYTFHGFAQRILQQEALAGGVPLGRELLASDKQAWREVVEDAWRLLANDENHPLALRLIAKAGSPQALAEQLLPLLGLPSAHIYPEPPEPAPDESALNAARQQLLTQVQELASSFAEQWPEARRLLDPAALNQNRYKFTQIDPIADAITMALALPGVQAVDALGAIKGLAKLGSDALKDGTKKGQQTPQHPLFDQLNELAVRLQSYETHLLHAWQDWQYQLATVGIQTLRERKRAQAVCSYNDLLVDLSEALDGPDGQRLAAQLRKAYPLALIDEFQDTDPLQWQILHRVFGPGAAADQARQGAEHSMTRRGSSQSGSADNGMILVGDPKQAIYGFRGADVFAYLEAVRVGHTVTMHRNYRSNVALVDAVNQIFDRRAAFVLSDIHFQPVSAYHQQADAGAGIQFAWQPEINGGKSELRAEAAALAAAQASRWLAAGVSAGDIAILVSSHVQGEWVARALEERGLKCARMARSGVFSSEEQDYLVRLLRCLQSPGERGPMLSLLLTPLLGWSINQVLALNAGHDADSLVRAEQLAALLASLGQQWQDQGFASISAKLVDALGIADCLLSRVGGERSLTNLEHLLELLTLQSQQPGMQPQALIDWLVAQYDAPQPDDAGNLRLENDNDILRVMTIHKSKGLEFDYVLCPFLWDDSRGPGSRVRDFHDPERDHALSVWLGSDAPQRVIDQQAIEQQAGSRRLLYVALTRARLTCWILWGGYHGVEKTALAQLLHHNIGSGKTLDVGCMRNQLEALVQVVSGAIRMESATLSGPSESVSPGPPELLTERRHRDLKRTWRVSSYSALLPEQNDHVDPVDYDQAAAQRSPAVALAESLDPAEPRFRLPAGARTGNFLHALLERLDFQQPDQIASLIAELGPRFSLPGQWADTIEELILSVLQTPFGNDASVRLADIPRHQRLDELEFYYPLAKVTPQDLASQLPRAALSDPGAATPAPMRALEFAPFKGFMRGFIDLVFEHQGRWYLVDYKSNRLGYSFADYAPAQLQLAMTDHHYDLQYLLYLVALLRFLKRCLPDFDYQRQFGGVAYLFLRGMHPGQGANAGVHFVRPPEAQIQALEGLFQGQDGAHLTSE